MNQYADFYNPKRKAILTVNAVYCKRIGCDNPYVLALPPKRSIEELKEVCRKSPGLPPLDEFNKLDDEDKLFIIEKLKNTRVYLPYYMNIEVAVERALIDSYEHRVSVETKREYGKYICNDESTSAYQHSEITEMSDAPTGFSVLGLSGCGKTTGINNVLRKYPKCIIHNPGTTQQHIQVPVILAHMRENSNFHGLYRHIGKMIDKSIGNSSHAYENELGGKDTLSAKFDKLCRIIEILNIGLLIIDEIELIDDSRVKEGTLETFMSLSNQTGIAVGVIGTEDSFSKLFKYTRTTRRMGELINADKYCADKKNTIAILGMLYAYLPKPVPLTRECIDAYYKESKGVISKIIKLFVGVSQKLAKGKNTEVTPKLIKSVAKTVLSSSKAKEEHYPEAQIVEDKEYAEETVRMLSSQHDDDTFDSPEIPQIDRLPTISNVVKCAIHAYPGNNFTDSEIESALRKILKNAPENDLQAVINGTFIELRRKQDAKSEKLVKQEKAALDLEELKKSLNKTTDI